jgi:hypothetical protein
VCVCVCVCVRVCVCLCVCVCVCVCVSSPSMSVGVPRDPTADLLPLFASRPFGIPAKHEVKQYLMSPLSAPIPISHRRYDQLQQVHLVSDRVISLLFTVGNASAELLWDHFISTIIHPLPHQASEFSYIGFWDSVLSRALELFPALKPDRNTHHGSSTGKRQRPDQVTLLHGLCLFRGEEKADNNGDPAAELRDKLIWSYGENVEYIFAYHAIGEQVTFDIITADKQVLEQHTFNFGHASDRLLAFLSVVNIARLLPLIAERCPERKEAEFEHKERKGKVLSFSPDSVIKRFTAISDTDYQRMSQVYDAIKGIDYCIQSIRQSRKRTHDEMEAGASFMFERVGIESKPQNQLQLVNALRCVLTALVGLHKKGFIHRDLRWPNVLLHASGYWTLIDFDDAVAAPASDTSAGHLSRESHALEMFDRKTHSFPVDVWGVGHLIVTSGVGITNLLLDQLKHSLMATDPDARPTAEAALAQLETIDCMH